MGSHDQHAEDADAALRAALFQAALDCIIIIDSAGLIVEFNEAAERTFGHKRGAVLGQCMAEILVPEKLRNAHFSGMEKYLQSGAHAVLGKRIEVPALHKDGRELMVELAITPVHLTDQTYFTAYLRDITERLAAEAELKNSRQRYRDLFESSGDAIFIHSLDGKIIDVNESAEQLVGWKRDELIGMRLPTLHPVDDHAVAKTAIAKVREAGDTRLDIRFLHKSGVEIPTEVNARTFEADGEVLVHAVVRDVSERARTEAELRAAKTEAEQANAAKTEFLANMSHEMRTPLNGVIGPLGLIQRSELSPEAARMVKLAERSAESLLTLIDDVLDISHIESGRIELSDEAYAPNDILDQVREIFSNSTADKGISLAVDNLPETLRLVGDAGRVRQVLFNLVGNAIKFTSSGSVTVKAGLTSSPDGPQLSFSVIDTGVGFDQDRLPELFSRFQQGGGASSVTDGVGLGLAITRELVELMGGDIDATSKVGEGSTFCVRIPAIDAAPETPSTPDRQRQSEHLQGRVLLAEDSNTNAVVVANMLARIGIEPVIVPDGAAAVQAIEDQVFDLIIMDVGMPVMDGLEASRLIRQSGNNIPIIALTAHALPENREQTQAAGMNGFLTKPIRLNELVRELRKWLPAADIAAHAVLDPGCITERWEDDLDGYAFVLGIFLDELANRQATITEHLQSQDLGRLRHEAHAIKGGASNVGADALSHAAGRLEHASGMDQRDGTLDRLLANLGRAAEAFRQEAEKHITPPQGEQG
ncbi:PAS domain-containing sensor histidine kinase [Maricaulis sp.]|uniref:PAS domain-containing sensor histidine kinase n=1 Tax=unclassified Maricaulis TaxID=2632371 RepID=UPI001B075502|nr:PAS domain S-box protein [Maricaulis sp.]MBO6798554.1 PAS domain S-box protein [Maricaulis sp.]